MPDSGLCVSRICINPATAFPTPDKARVEFKSAPDEGIGMIQLTGHCFDRASGSQNDRIIRIKDAGALAK